MAKVRVGVIGCGVMGPRHADAAAQHPEAEVVAVADLIPEKREALAEKMGGAKMYVQGTELLADPDIDAVTLAMPAVHRTALALEAFKQGKHVLTEKPVAMSAGEVEQIMAAKGDLVAACCSARYGLTPSSKKLAEFIGGGGIGNIRGVHCRCMMGCGARPETERPTWRLRRNENGGGIMMNWGCYDLNFFMAITNWQLVPELVLAQAWQVPDIYRPFLPPDSDAETHFTSFYRCAGGEVITFERAEYVTSMGSNVWTIVGDLGSLHLHMTTGEKTITLDKADAEKGTISETFWEGEEDHTLAHVPVIHDYIDAIIEKRAPAADMKRSWLIQRMTDAVYESAESGAAVAIGKLG